MPMLWNLGKREPQEAPVRCNWCRAALAVHSPAGLRPAAIELHAHGAVSVKRLGWFCGRRCVSAYEARFRVILEPESQSGTEPPSA
jgi:hypothetical protein